MKGLRTAKYNVPDLEAAKKWYKEAFRKEPYFDESFYVGFEIGGYELGFTLQEGSGENRSDSLTVYWGVDDIHAEYDRLIELGAKEHEAPTNVGGELMVASVWDPWNNLIGIIYNPYFKVSE